MNHVFDAIAITIVLLCALYALRMLLPQQLLIRLTGNAQLRKKSCGGCDGCDRAAKPDDKACH